MTPDLFATLLMHPSAPLLRGLCFVAALMLLWLGGEVSSAARPRASQPGVGAGIAAAVLVALALWWPGQFVGATRAAPGPRASCRCCPDCWRRPRPMPAAVRHCG